MKKLIPFLQKSRSLSLLASVKITVLSIVILFMLLGGCYSYEPQKTETSELENSLLSFYTDYSQYTDPGEYVSLFSDLPDEHKFWLLTGTGLSSLGELYKSFDEMDDEVYKHHVKKDENDFADWVENVYHDGDLAHQLRHTKTRREARRILEKHTDKIMKVVGNHTDERSFFKALIDKLANQNKQLEDEVKMKKDWLVKRQKEMELWEKKNIEQEKMLFHKYEKMEQQEKLMLEKFKELEKTEGDLKKELETEKSQLEQKQSLLVEAKV